MECTLVRKFILVGAQYYSGANAASYELLDLPGKASTNFLVSS